MNALSQLQRDFLNRFQGGFPLTERPYLHVAPMLGTDEATLISTVRGLLDDGTLSRFGPLYDVERLGGRVTLAALSVPGRDFDRVAAIVNALPQVAHNYRRDHELNMWLVLATPGEEELRRTILRIGSLTGLPLYNFPKLREFHLGFWILLGERGELDLRRVERPGAGGVQESPDAIDLAIVRATQTGLPLVPEPFAALAEETGCDSGTLIERLRKMLSTGAVRRIGAVPNHYRLGLRGNGMSVWDVDDHKVEALGKRIGTLEFVSHCYLRPRHPPLWSYNLFAMVHGRDRAEVATKVEIIARLAGPDARHSQVLYSTAVLKKTGLRLAA
jgi:DNA-binding Lrp family transcriptional regulator